MRRRVAAGILSLAALAAPAAAQVGDAHRGIRAVDFRNFTYDEACVGEGRRITVTNGEFSQGDEMDRIFFAVIDVAYGDLTGDGVDEAIVRTICNTGGTGQFSDGSVFVMRAGKPVEVATLGIGDRADGGIHDLRIENARIVVERYGQEHSGACCPEYIETYRLRLDGTRLASAGPTTRRAFQRYDDAGSGAAQRVRFLKGTSSVTLSGLTNGNEKFVFGARSGQTLAIRFTSKDPKASVRVTDAAGKRLMTLQPNERWSGELPSSGDFTIAIDSTSGIAEDFTDYTMDVSIR